MTTAMQDHTHMHVFAPLPVSWRGLNEHQNIGLTVAYSISELS